ncbi:MAG TPA: dethiobiotin synthase [Candidatus Obscuribacterales bacterium]
MSGKQEPKTNAHRSGKGQGRSAPGLVVVGTEPGCGKTVVATGLAAVLQEEGFAARAIKPILIGQSQECQAELSFMSSITRTVLDYPTHLMRAPGLLSSFGWAEALRVCRSGTQCTIVELPGSAATPLTSADGNWKDNADLVKELDWPCLVVTCAGPDAMEKLLLNTVYLQSRGATVVALVTVETGSDFSPPRQGGRVELAPAGVPEIALQERTGVPYIGNLRYSASISVPRVNQGNLIKTTSACLDLLPVIKALNLRISV